jgi:hypothetical protein
MIRLLLSQLGLVMRVVVVMSYIVVVVMRIVVVVVMNYIVVVY